jgi:hypothetical protein
MYQANQNDAIYIRLGDIVCRRYDRNDTRDSFICSSNVGLLRERH